MQRYNDADRLLVVAGGSGAGWMLPMIEMFCRRRSTSQSEGSVENVHNTDHEKQTGDGRSKNNWSGPTSLRVVLATRDTDSRIWFLRTVGDLLARYSASHSSTELDVQVHLTGEAKDHADVSKTNMDVHVTQVSGSSSSADNIEIRAHGETAIVPGKELGGRPHLPAIVHEEGTVAAESGVILNVFVCGPETMQNDVRNAVAKENLSIIKGTSKAEVYLHSEHFSWA